MLDIHPSIPSLSYGGENLHGVVTPPGQIVGRVGNPRDVVIRAPKDVGMLGLVALSSDFRRLVVIHKVDMS